ncbi:MAG: HIT domain-containing protein [Candidatus Nanopelagicales bacterium]|nr:HIT domain-containing protein [Candidatus Nanopelagicales bacterium]
MTDCLFCAIGSGAIPAAIVAETDRVAVFRDVNPQAPVHLLAIPKAHFGSVAELAAVAPDLVSDLITEGSAAAVAEGATNGYRIVFNTGHDGGQSVGHVHTHVLGGRQLTWPPG